VNRWRKLWKISLDRVCPITSLFYAAHPHPPDDDLIDMYLTDKKNGVDRELDDHEELEVLLESFSKQVEEIVNEAENIEVTCSILPTFLTSRL
jgi:hypothetical protein